MWAYAVEHLRKRYPGGVLASDDLSFSVAQGEIFGVLGPNGAGKSTLVRQMVGLTRPSFGTIRLFGQAVRPHDARLRRSVSFLAQSPLALLDLTVLEAIAYTGMLRGLKEAAARRRAQELLEELGIGDRGRRVIGHLSGGEHRLAGLASALAADPPIMILDEPTNELDPVIRTHVWDILERRRRQGSTIVLVTHNVVEAERVVDRVAIMARGRIAMLGAPEELKRELHLRVAIELQGASDAVIRAAAELGEVWEAGQGKVRVRLSVDLGRALQRLTDPALFAGVEGLRVLHPSLEDVYLSIHGQEEGHGDARAV